MTRYWRYWRRGWYVWVLMLCINISVLLVAFPLAMAFHQRPGAYLLAGLLVWVTIGAPYVGWLFERFAAYAPRIGRDEVLIDREKLEPLEAD